MSIKSILGLKSGSATCDLPPSLQDAFNMLSAAFDTRAQIDSAIARNAHDRQAAGQARQDAEATAERLEIDLALEIDATKIAELEAAVAAARAAATAAGATFDRAHRLQGALYTRAGQADETIAATSAAFRDALNSFGSELKQKLSDEARAAVQHLTVVLARGHALAATIGALQAHSGFLEDVMVQDPVSHQPLVAGRHVCAADGRRVDLSAKWQEIPAAAALGDAMARLADMKRRAAAHVRFVPPAPTAAAVYVVSEANRLAGEHNRAIDERETAEWEKLQAKRVANRAAIDVDFAKMQATHAAIKAGGKAPAPDQLSQNQRAAIANRPIEERETAERERRQAAARARYLAGEEARRRNAVSSTFEEGWEMLADEELHGGNPVDAAVNMLQNRGTGE